MICSIKITMSQLNENLWSEAINAMPIPLFVARPEGELIALNPLLAELVGDSPVRLEDLLSDDSAPAARLAAKAEPDPAEPLKVSVSLKNGQAAVMSVRAEADREVIVGEIRPVSPGEVSEAEKLEGVIQMARALGHDLNQPLTVIMGQAEIMTLRLKDNPDAVSRLAKVISEAERMEQLTRKLSRIVRFKD